MPPRERYKPADVESTRPPGPALLDELPPGQLRPDSVDPDTGKPKRRNDRRPGVHDEVASTPDGVPGAPLPAWAEGPRGQAR